MHTTHGGFGAPPGCGFARPQSSSRQKRRMQGVYSGAAGTKAASAGAQHQPQSPPSVSTAYLNYFVLNEFESAKKATAPGAALYPIFSSGSSKTLDMSAAALKQKPWRQNMNVQALHTQRQQLREERLKHPPVLYRRGGVWQPQAGACGTDGAGAGATRGGLRQRQLYPFESGVGHHQKSGTQPAASDASDHFLVHDFHPGGGFIPTTFGAGSKEAKANNSQPRAGPTPTRVRPQSACSFVGGSGGGSGRRPKVAGMVRPLSAALSSTCGGGSGESGQMLQQEFAIRVSESSYPVMVIDERSRKSVLSGGRRTNRTTLQRAQSAGAIRKEEEANKDKTRTPTSTSGGIAALHRTSSAQRPRPQSASARPVAGTRGSSHQLAASGDGFEQMETRPPPAFFYDPSAFYLPGRDDMLEYLEEADEIMKQGSSGVGLGREREDAFRFFDASTRSDQIHLSRQLKTNNKISSEEVQQLTQQVLDVRNFNKRATSTGFQSTNSALPRGGVASTFPSFRGTGHQHDTNVPHVSSTNYADEDEEVLSEADLGIFEDDDPDGGNTNAFSRSVSQSPEKMFNARQKIVNASSADVVPASKSTFDARSTTHGQDATTMMTHEHYNFIVTTGGSGASTAATTLLSSNNISTGNSGKSFQRPSSSSRIKRSSCRPQSASLTPIEHQGAPAAVLEDPGSCSTSSLREKDKQCSAVPSSNWAAPYNSAEQVRKQYVQSSAHHSDSGATLELDLHNYAGRSVQQRPQVQNRTSSSATAGADDYDLAFDAVDEEPNELPRRATTSSGCGPAELYKETGLFQQHPELDFLDADDPASPYSVKSQQKSTNHDIAGEVVADLMLRSSSGGLVGEKVLEVGDQKSFLGGEQGEVEQAEIEKIEKNIAELKRQIAENDVAVGKAESEEGDLLAEKDNKPLENFYTDAEAATAGPGPHPAVGQGIASGQICTTTTSPEEHEEEPGRFATLAPESETLSASAAVLEVTTPKGGSSHSDIAAADDVATTAGIPTASDEFCLTTSRTSKRSHVEIQETDDLQTGAEIVILAGTTSNGQTTDKNMAAGKMDQERDEAVDGGQKRVLGPREDHLQEQQQTSSVYHYSEIDDFEDNRSDEVAGHAPQQPSSPEIEIASTSGVLVSASVSTSPKPKTTVTASEGAGNMLLCRGDETFLQEKFEQDILHIPEPAVTSPLSIYSSEDIGEQSAWSTSSSSSPSLVEEEETPGLPRKEKVQNVDSAAPGAHFLENIKQHQSKRELDRGRKFEDNTMGKTGKKPSSRQEDYMTGAPAASSFIARVAVLPNAEILGEGSPPIKMTSSTYPSSLSKQTAKLGDGARQSSGTSSADITSSVTIGAISIQKSADLGTTNYDGAGEISDEYESDFFDDVSEIGEVVAAKKNLHGTEKQVEGIMKQEAGQQGDEDEEIEAAEAAERSTPGAFEVVPSCGKTQDGENSSEENLPLTKMNDDYREHKFQYLKENLMQDFHGTSLATRLDLQKSALRRDRVMKKGSRPGSGQQNLNPLPRLLQQRGGHRATSILK
ncbi:unnamed protein product [Amoebophrya sp. A120]|nr:unnamed protein product [Amoebophrya sp. A120]|eukprot:GSA120T00016364001.1